MNSSNFTLCARIAALSLVLAGATACGERLSNTSSGTPKSTAASPSAVVIGTAPAEPQAPAQGDTAQTTPPAGAQSELSKATQTNAQPLEGNNNSHSTTAPVTPQKAEGVNPQEVPPRAKP